MSDNIAESNAFVEEAVASEEIVEDEPVIEETVVEEVTEEPVFEETAVEESEVAEDPVIEDEITEEVTVEETPSFDEIDSSDNELSESNIDYLTAKSDDDITEEPVNSDLKQDIKSVLLYMDQLLENLPEDKIIEFAKSDEFTTYKKLFSELGLS